MGMDVYGRKPTSDAGKYFRANVWSWRPIHELMVQLCPFLGANLLRSMAYNDGAGPKDQAVCDRMADAFDRWLEHNAYGATVTSDELAVEPTGQLVSRQAASPDARSPYSIDDDRLKEWVNFLRSCGGFKVH